MRAKSVLFFAKCPMNFVLFEPVYKRLAEDSRLSFRFTGKYQGQKDPRLVYEGFDLRGGRLIANWAARLRSFDLYITPDFRLTGRNARVKVHMFHGFSIRNFAVQERALRFDRLFLIGPYMRRRFLEVGLLKEGDPRLVEVGMPKLDPLVNGEFDRETVLTGLGLDPTRPTVLFAPTWIEGGCLDTKGHEIVRALGKLPVNTIIKLHDNSFDQRKQRYDWGQELPPILGEHQVLARGFDSNPYLAAADVLISDASSVANEFLVLDRPLIFFRLPELEAAWPSTDRETWGTKTGVAIDHPDELRSAVDAAIAHPERGSDIRQAAAEDYFYPPGTASERGAKELLKSVDLAETSG